MPAMMVCCGSDSGADIVNKFLAPIYAGLDTLSFYILVIM